MATRSSELCILEDTPWANRSSSSVLGKSFPFYRLFHLRRLCGGLSWILRQPIFLCWDATPDESLSTRLDTSVLTILNRPLKTSHTLLVLSHLVDEKVSTPLIAYYALDLEKLEFECTLRRRTQTPRQGRNQRMLGTYDEGLKLSKVAFTVGTPSSKSSRKTPPLRVWRTCRLCLTGTRSSENGYGSDVMSTPSTPDLPQTPLHILFLGSSLDNFSRGHDTN